MCLGLDTSAIYVPCIFRQLCRLEVIHKDMLCLLQSRYFTDVLLLFTRWNRNNLNTMFKEVYYIEKYRPILLTSLYRSRVTFLGQLTFKFTTFNHICFPNVGASFAHLKCVFLHASHYAPSTYICITPQ